MQSYIFAFLLPAMSLVFAALFIALWWPDRARKHVLAYAVCYAMLGLALVLNLVILGHVGPAGIVIYHIVTMIGMLALLSALAQRSEQRLPFVALVVSVLIASIIAGAAISMGNFELGRMAQNVHSATIWGYGALLVWQGNVRRLADKALLGTMTLFSVAGFVLPFAHTLVRGNYGIESEPASLLVTIHIILLIALLFSLGTCLAATIMNENMRIQRDLGTIDSLSGLVVRQRFESDANAMINRAGESDVAVSLIMIDIDHFKKLNDTYGHVAGDQAIARFGALIKNTIRDDDISGRIGGEEFCVMVWNCPLDNAANLADRMRRALSGPMIKSSDRCTGFSASFGVSQWKPGESYTSLFKRADSALYTAKDSGRNRVVTEEGSVKSDNDAGFKRTEIVTLDNRERARA